MIGQPHHSPPDARVWASPAGMLAIFALLAAPLPAEPAHPFHCADEMEATIDIKSHHNTPFNNLLLGLNCNWPENQYGKTGFNNPQAEKLIRKLKPAALRWPHGVWANFYDWESDGRRITDSYQTPYNTSVTNHPELQYGFDALKSLHDILGFDVVFAWNINYDSPEKGARRLIDRRKKGFNVRWIELGNETFWKTQRSEAVSDVGKYVEVSIAHAAALKAIDPEVRVSVNATWRDPFSSEWNRELAKHDYYDAVALHKYITHPETTEGAAGTLRARSEMIETAETMQKVFPERPIWLTEWAIEGGENAASVLGMADTYLGIIHRPDLFEIASYFQINAKQPLILYDKQTGEHRKTGFGAAYEIIREVFEDSRLQSSATTSDQLAGNLDAVTAETVLMNGKLIILAVNKSAVPVPLIVQIDGKTKNRLYQHQALLFQSVGDFKTFGLDESPLVNVVLVDGEAILPPLSINKIRISK